MNKIEIDLVKKSYEELQEMVIQFATDKFILKNQLEEYENMRKEVNKYIEEHIVYETDDCINGMQFCSYHLYDFSKEDLLNILNKVGDSNEKI